MRESSTGENDEIGLLGLNHPLNKRRRIEVGASRHLGRKHIQTRRRFAVGIVHVRHLQYLELPTSPKSQPRRLVIPVLLRRSQNQDRKQRRHHHHRC